MSDDNQAILLVDDEEGLRLTFAMLLARAGYRRVEVAAGLAEARDLLQRQSFACVISDIVLEDGTGIDLLRYIRQQGWTCPVVMITGYPNIETAAEAVRLGAFDYLPKPVKKEALLEVVARAVAHHLRQEEEHQRLQRQEEEGRYRAQILAALPEMVVAVDGDHRICQMNDGARRWAAVHAPTLQPGACLADLGGPLAHGLMELAATVRRRGAAVHDRVVTVSGGGDRERVVHAGGGPWRDKAGGVVLTLHDITEERGLAFQGMIGKSRVMQALFATIVNVARSDAAVLITGESGTGKELVTEAIHRLSARARGPLVKVDCTAIPDNLMESELFGHARGAFTGATSRREGRLLSAHRGTLFLDEIGDISPRLQLRLLNFLQEQSFFPVGSDRPVQVDVRIIAATNADLQARVAAGTFREDLYFRLRVVDVHVPPLRARGDDVLYLASHFLRRFSAKFHRNVVGFSDAVKARFLEYPWPGNVRELEHVVERAVVLCSSTTITTDLLPPDLREPGPAAEAAAPRRGEEPPADEGQAIIRALARTGGNKAAAARLLGVDRSTLYRRIAALGLDVERELQKLEEDLPKGDPG